MESPSDPTITGIFTSDDTRIRIDLAITLSAFEADPIAANCDRRLAGDWTEFTLKSVPLYAENFIITWRFEKRALHLIELFLQQPDDGTSWADWTEEKEQRRKQTAEQWAKNVFSRDLTVMPFVMEDGKKITPFEITWQTPRHAEFPWGKIVSFYDAKSGSSGLLLKRKK